MSLICGTHDEYLIEDRLTSETQKAHDLFKDQLHVLMFDGKHEMNIALINNLV